MEGAGLRVVDEDVLRRAELAIDALEGVEAARIVPGDHRAIDELHVIVDATRSPKQTVRDVQSLLAAGFGLELDRRVVSVVQLAGSALPVAGSRPRVVLETVQLEVRGGETAVTVVLDDGSEQVRGCSAPASAAGTLVATAEATLDALSDHFPTWRLAVAGIEVVAVGGAEVVVAMVTATDGRLREDLSGSASVRDALPDAAARAVLDATNRLRRPD